MSYANSRGQRGRAMTRRGRLRPILLLLAGAFLALLLGLGLMLRWIDSQPIGSGENALSPDGLYRASAMDFSQKSFWTGKVRTWFEFRVTGPDQDWQLTSSAIPGPDFGSRSDHRVIEWQPDSAAVRFVFPGVTLRIEAGPGMPAETSSGPTP